jgi:hypothetical protein
MYDAYSVAPSTTSDDGVIALIAVAYEFDPASAIQESGDES